MAFKGNPLLGYKFKMDNNPTAHELRLEQDIICRLGVRYRTQWIIGKYIADFAFPDHQLIVEVDGIKGHTTPAEREKDRIRDEFCAGKGWRTLRLLNSEVTADVVKCGIKVAKALTPG